MAVKPKTSKAAAIVLSVAGAGLLCFAAYVLIAYPRYSIPAQSMQPTLEVDDRLYGFRFAYGFNTKTVPLRGDIAIFTNPKRNQKLIKRVAGLPGDVIAYREGRLVINGDVIAREAEGTLFYRENKSHHGESEARVVQVTKYKEAFPGEVGFHYIYERGDEEYNDNRGPFTVPAGHVFFLGDNRDNSRDSRAPGGPGFVPMGNITARAERMVLSFKRCKKEEGLHCPGKRWFQKL